LPETVSASLKLSKHIRKEYPIQHMTRLFALAEQKTTSYILPVRQIKPFMSYTIMTPGQPESVARRNEDSNHCALNTHATTQLSGSAQVGS